MTTASTFFRHDTVLREIIEALKTFILNIKEAVSFQLRPDIRIFSNSVRKVIIIELTCSCEEKMESWHCTKID